MDTTNVSTHTLGVTMKMRYDEKRVHRNIALPVSAFDILKAIQRRDGFDTNGEVITALLMEKGEELNLMKNDDDQLCGSNA